MLFPMSCRRPKAHFPAGRLDCNPWCKACPSRPISDPRPATPRNIPSATKTFPTRKKSHSNYFLITVTRFEISQINFRKLPDTCWICVSCVTLPAWDPCPCWIIFIAVTRFEVFRINWVMFSWQLVQCFQFSWARIVETFIAATDRHPS